MKFTGKTILSGILIWLVPFLVAIPFYSPEGALQVDVHFFKTVMIITGGLIGALFLILLFKEIPRDYKRNGWIIGITWLIINWILDAGILLPLNGMDILTYFGQIGLRYLMILIMSILAGYIAENASHNSHISS
ncbi:MAG: hypothetical protein GXY48_02915 [Methanomicrobiales archaeon]|nr:hypothetical protein [Methanomicrobiales archaeon]